MKKKSMFVVIIALLYSSVEFAGAGQFDHCNALIRHGMQDVQTKYGAEVFIGYNYHKYCRTSRSTMSDNVLSEAEASIFGFGDGSGSFNRARAIENVDSFCKENEALSSKSSSLYTNATKFSSPALEAWNQCQQAASKQVQIKLTHRSENATKMTFEIDSTQKGTIYLTGLEYKGYTCKTFYKQDHKILEAIPSGVTSHNITTSEDLDIPIDNQNIHINCDRNEVTVFEKNEVKKLKYQEGSVSIFTTGPSFSITIPEVVDEYHHTPKNSVLAFSSSSCPAGWTEYKPAYGRFIRGIDRSGKSIDPDANREVGTYQSDMFERHEHGITWIHVNEAKQINGKWNNIYPQLPNGYSDRASNASSKGASAKGGDETRPRNVALLYCIKN
jgi:hypothetical protein